LAWQLPFRECAAALLDDCHNCTANQLSFLANWRSSTKRAGEKVSEWRFSFLLRSRAQSTGERMRAEDAIVVVAVPPTLV